MALDVRWSTKRIAWLQKYLVSPYRSRPRDREHVVIITSHNSLTLGQKGETILIPTAVFFLLEHTNKASVVLRNMSLRTLAILIRCALSS